MEKITKYTTMIQKIALGISIVALGLAVFALTRGGETTDHPAGQAEQATNRKIALEQGDQTLPRVAFIRGDSLNFGYKFISDKQDELISSGKASEGKLQRSLQKAEREYEELMTYIQSGEASESDMQTAQERIMQLQYELQGLEQEEQQRLARKEQQMQIEIVNRLNAYLKKYAEENEIDLILNWGVSGEGVLYGSTPFDITNDVVRGLNEAYALELAQQNGN